MLALIQDNAVIDQVQPGRWYDLPNGGRLTTHDGWSQDGYSRAAIQTPATVPDGKRVTSAAELISGVPTYVLEDIPPPIVEDYQVAIVAMLDGAAQARRYDNATSISTYVNSTNPVWAAEAQAYAAWRDAVWGYTYTELDKVLAGEREQPSVADFLAELPQLAWPG